MSVHRPIPHAAGDGSSASTAAAAGESGALPRLIAVHDRLGGMGGHRFHEALGLRAESDQRGYELVLMTSAETDAATLAALGDGVRPVLLDRSSN